MLLALSAVAVASGCGDAGSPFVVVNSVKWVAFESCMIDAVGAGTSPSATTGVTTDLSHLADDQELHHAVYAPLAYTNVAASVTPSVDGARTLSRALVQRVRDGPSVESVESRRGVGCPSDFGRSQVD